MKKFLEIFFITLGVIFFIILIIIAYLFVADPFGIKPLIKTFTAPSPQVSVPTDKTKNTDTTTSKPSLLNPAQEKALKTMGVDPAALPTSISPAQEQCFIDALGAARVNEIKAGGTPTPIDLFKAKSCLQ